jgi:membrane protease YdiL (CAAX protease family)
MREKIKLKKFLIFIEVFFIYLSFWFLLGNLKTNGIWETVILNILFFLVMPIFLFKKKFPEKPEEKKITVVLQILALWLIFGLMLFSLEDISFLKLNYLSRMDWFFGDWWIILGLNFILLPVILFCQEFFFRDFLFNRIKEDFSIKIALFSQAGLFVVFEMLFFETLNWQFFVFNFILALIFGVFYNQTKTIWYSFFLRWGLILILEGLVLYRIQQFNI